MLHAHAESVPFLLPSFGAFCQKVKRLHDRVFERAERFMARDLCYSIALALRAMTQGKSCQTHIAQPRAPLKPSKSQTLLPPSKLALQMRIPRARLSVHTTRAMSGIDIPENDIVALGAGPAEPAAAALAYFALDTAGTSDQKNL